MKKFSPFPVKIINQKGVVLSRHHSIKSAQKKYSIPNLHNDNLKALRYKKIIALGDLFMVPYSLTRDEIMGLVKGFNNTKHKVAYQIEINNLKNNYKASKTKVSSFIAVLNKDFSIKYIWQGKTTTLATKLNINYSTLKASLCKFPKNKKAYLNGTKERLNDEFYAYLKDII